MKAMLLTGYGGPEMLRYGDAPDPVPAPEEIVVDVHAASVNAADYKVRLGGRGYNLQFPHILGRDFSGVVAKTGEGVTDFAVGDSSVRCPGCWDRRRICGKACNQGCNSCPQARSPVSPTSRCDGVDRDHCHLGYRGHGAASGRRDDLDPRWCGRVSPVSRSNWRNTSVPPWSPPPAPPISTMYAHSEPTAWSTTTPRISPRSSPTATWCSTRSGVTFRHARIAC